MTHSYPQVVEGVALCEQGAEQADVVDGHPLESLLAVAGLPVQSQPVEEVGVEVQQEVFRGEQQERELQREDVKIQDRELPHHPLQEQQVGALRHVELALAQGVLVGECGELACGHVEKRAPCGDVRRDQRRPEKCAVQRRRAECGGPGDESDEKGGQRQEQQGVEEVEEGESREVVVVGNRIEQQRVVEPRADGAVGDEERLEQQQRVANMCGLDER